MTREEQFEILKMTYIFDQTVDSLSIELRRLKANPPKSPKVPIKPIAPQRRKIEVTPKPYPEIIPPEIKREQNEDGKSFAKKHGAGLVLGGYIYAGLMLKNAIDDSKARKEEQKRMIEEIRNSQEYQDKCKKIDEENKKKQEEMDIKLHEEYMRDYEEYRFLLQEYNEELEQYNKKLEEYNVFSVIQQIK